MRLLRASSTTVLYRQDAQWIIIIIIGIQPLGWFGQRPELNVSRLVWLWYPWIKVQEFQTHNFICYVVPHNVVYQY